jgi:2-polyprenyl-3-methyl-5-hydroxy-6-metoxy-1,4-benzoquinol methylase
MNITPEAQMETPMANPLPTSHVRSLSSIENGYWWFQGRVFWAEQLIRQAWKQRGIPNTVNYIDLGCGTGGFAGQLMNKLEIGRTALLDGDPAVLQLAERVKGTEAHLVDFNSEFKLPWTPNLLTCMDVLEHIEEDAKFLHCASSQLSSDGLVVISVPALPSLYSEWDKQLGHYRRYTAKSLRKTIEAAGLKVLSSKYMWSFLMPAAPIRKLRAKRYAKNMEFESVSPLTNSTLVWLSKMEWKLSSFLPAPLGTSLIAIAHKS